MAAATTDPILNLSNFEEVVLLNGELVKRAKAREEYEANTTKALDAVIPTAVEALVKYGCVDATQADTVAKILRDPVKTVEFVSKLAAKAHDGEPDGVPVAPVGGSTRKKASYTPPPDEGARAFEKLQERSRTWNS